MMDCSTVELKALQEQISFVHSEYPSTCASPNLFSMEECEEFPGFLGTGFFARRGDAVFYITARHCLTKNQNENIANIAARLHIPYALEGATKSTNDYVQFDEVLSLGHQSDDIPGRFVDVLVLTVVRPAKSALDGKLFERAVKLPPNGEWLDRFVEHSLVKDDFEMGKGIRFTVTGYPQSGTASKIEYPDDKPVNIVTQSASFGGYLGKGSGPDRYKLNEVDWPEDLNGFSGSPVFVGFISQGCKNYALAGMMVTGGGGLAQFIRISVILQTLSAPALRD